MKYQSILILWTEKPDLRSEATGWTHESGENLVYYAGKKYGLHPDSWSYEHYVNNTHVGEFKSTLRKDAIITFSTPLHAMGCGWRLLQAPVKEDDGGYEWWFEKYKGTELL